MPSRIARCALVTCLLALAALIPAGDAPAAVNAVSACGTTLTAAGTYDLVKDLSCDDGGTAVRIEGNDITLKLNGHTIAGAHVAGQGNGVLLSGSPMYPRIVGPGTITGYLNGYGVQIASGFMPSVEETS